MNRINHNLVIKDISKFTISTGVYDNLYSEFSEELAIETTLDLSITEQRKLCFYAGMKAAQKLLEGEKMILTPVGYISKQSWDEHARRIMEDNDQTQG